MSDVTIGLIVLTALVVVLFCVAYARLGKLAIGTQIGVSTLALLAAALSWSIRSPQIPIWLGLTGMALSAAICLWAYRGRHSKDR